LSDYKNFKATTAEQVGLKLQESYDHLLANANKWAEILAFDPYPQTGMTPKELVWSKNKAKLFRYTSDKPPVHRTPVLCLHALINKAYILDLAPGMSVVERLVNDGLDVYLLDWGEFEWEDRNLDMADLVYKYIARAVQKVCKYSHTDELSILGYCMGGTMASMYASLFPQPRVRNMVLLASPLDFANASLTAIWLNPPFGNDADKIVDTVQLAPEKFVDIDVKMLRTVNNYIGTYSRLRKMVEEEVPVQLWKLSNLWVDDNVNFPGGVYRQWIKGLYLENQLIKGEFEMLGNRVDLEKIDSALLALAGAKDPIVVPDQVKAAMDAFASTDKEYHEFPIGHEGLVFGRLAQQEVYPLLSSWLAARSD
jgi:Poly(3-hydroxyalkanoate) synthetase